MDGLFKIDVHIQHTRGGWYVITTATWQSDSSLRCAFAPQNDLAFMAVQMLCSRFGYSEAREKEEVGFDRLR